MFSMEHCSNSPWSIANYNTMNYETLTTVFRNAVRSEDESQWVGSGPRVVRGRLDPCVVRTTVSWLLRYRDPLAEIAPNEWLNTISQPILERLRQNRAIANLPHGEWLPPSVSPYDPTVHGPVDFWESGRATNTRTRNGVDLGEEENRVGPDDAPGFRRRTTLVDVVEEQVDKGKFLLIGVGVLAVVGVGLYAYIKYSATQSMVGGGEGPFSQWAGPRFAPPMGAPSGPFPASPAPRGSLGPRRA